MRYRWRARRCHDWERGWGCDRSTEGKFDDLPEQRRRGLERMEEVYDFEMTDGTGDSFRYTADHLFAEIWNRPASPTATAASSSSGC